MNVPFYMSNICPQNPNLNRGDWNDLEEKSRQWAKKYGAVYIAMVAYQFSLERLQLMQRNDTSPYVEKVKELTELLEDYFKEE